jgi:phosphatidylinositol alpha-1,6-mannosyltransferase
VIGGNSGGVADAIENGVSGFLVDPLSTDEIAEKLILLLSDEALANKIGMAGRERILRGFTWDAITDKITGAVFAGYHRTQLHHQRQHQMSHGNELRDPNSGEDSE